MKMSTNTSKELVIFDIDKTLIKGQSQNLLIKYLYKKKYIGSPFYLKIILWFVLYKAGLVKDPLKIMRYGFSFSAGRTKEGVKQLLEDFYDNSLRNFFYKEALRILEQYKRKGNTIIIISNVVYPLAELIAEKLGVDYCLATELEEKDGVYTGRIKSNIVCGEEKWERMTGFLKENGVKFAKVSAYADHISDRYLLESVDDPYVVNPKKDMESLSKKNNWPMLYFKNTVT